MFKYFGLVVCKHESMEKQIRNKALQETKVLESLGYAMVS